MPVLTPETEALGESELLRGIQEAIPLALRKEREALIVAQKSHPWSPAERVRFIELTNQIETCEAERILLLSALARLRGVSLQEILSGLRTPKNPLEKPLLSWH